MTEEELKSYQEKLLKFLSNKRIILDRNKSDENRNMYVEDNELETMPENVRIEYVQSYGKDPKTGFKTQLSHVDIYRDDKLVGILEPSLDPFVLIKDEYLFLSYDGGFDIYNTLNDKHYHQELSIVPFYFTVEWTDIREDYNDKTKMVPYSMTIKAEGCYWGFEWHSVFFEMELSKEDNPKFAHMDLVLKSFKQWDAEDDDK